MVEIIWEAEGLVRKMSGVITGAEMDTSAKEIQGNAALDDMRYNIHDFTGVTEAQLSDDLIEFMGARARISVSNNPRIRIAFVGTHPIAYRLMDAFNNIGGDSKHRVCRFDTIEEARKYISSGTVGR